MPDPQSCCCWSKWYFQPTGRRGQGTPQTTNAEGADFRGADLDTCLMYRAETQRARFDDAILRPTSDIPGKDVSRLAASSSTTCAPSATTAARSRALVVTGLRGTSLPVLHIGIETLSGCGAR
jgi:uncharacterized protein YjbI with pentapeptide repeats